MSWEGAVFIFARWPWSLLGLAAGAYAVVVRRGLDFRVTPKGSDAASAAPVGVVIPYIGLSVVSALPAALTADPGTAAGFYAFALLNALIYLGILHPRPIEGQTSALVQDLGDGGVAAAGDEINGWGTRMAACRHAGRERRAEAFSN